MSKTVRPRVRKRGECVSEMQFVDEQIAQSRYSRASEYMRELIRADEKRDKVVKQQVSSH